jgi:hypothetical protein
MPFVVPALVATLASAILAFLVVLAARVVAGTSLRYSSAFTATLTAWIVTSVATYAVRTAGPDAAQFIRQAPGVFVLPLANLALLTGLLATLGRTVDDRRISLRTAAASAVIAVVVATAIGVVLIYAIYTPPAPSVMSG